MKVLKFVMSLSFAFALSLGFSNHFVEASGDQVNEKGTIPPPYEKPEIEMLNDGESDGENNTEEITVTVNKISDKAIPVPEGSGEWDYIGHDRFTHFSANFNSGGGNVKFVLTQHYNTSQNQQYSIREYDESNTDETLSAFSIPGYEGTWEVIISGVSNFVDGDNGKAELYVEKTNYIDTTSADVEVWD